ncbi:MAG: sulfotransferase family protein [Candidatus Thalassarchaeum sp.]
MPDVRGFLLGAPKSGTTWLAGALEQHPGICVSEPKEPNVVATHKGTFGRDTRLPDWERYASCFKGPGLKVDCSVHALACPVAPNRMFEWWPDARFVVCLREPVSRTISHWNMVLDTGEDSRHQTDWSVFREAWGDDRLRLDSLYGNSLKRWFDLFPAENFLLIDSILMRREPGAVLRMIEGHLGLEPHNFDLGAVTNSNVASDRRPLTLFGEAFKVIVSLIPRILKDPLVRSLQGRNVNIYSWPILSAERKERGLPNSSETENMRDEIRDDLEVLHTVTGFDVSEWLSGLQ